MDHVDENPGPHVLKGTDVKVESEMKGSHSLLQLYSLRPRASHLLSTQRLEKEGDLSHSFSAFSVTSLSYLKASRRKCHTFP